MGGGGEQADVAFVMEDRIFGILGFEFGCNILSFSRGPPPSQCRIPKPISVRNAEPLLR